MPVTVIVKAAPPGATAEGTIGSRCGTGLGVVARVAPTARQTTDKTRTASKLLRETTTIFFMKAPLQGCERTPQRWGRPISAQSPPRTLLADDGVRKSGISFCNIRNLCFMGYVQREFSLTQCCINFHVALIRKEHLPTTLHLLFC